MADHAAAPPSPSSFNTTATRTWTDPSSERVPSEVVRSSYKEERPLSGSNLEEPSPCPLPAFLDQ